MKTTKTKPRSKPIERIKISVRRPASLRLKRILVTTDFSEESKKALPYAANFAERFGSEVMLLNVLDPPFRFAGLESVMLLQSGDATMGRLYSGLDALAEKRFGKAVRAETQVRAGKPYREIIKAARDSEAGLLVMATHGYSGLKHAFLGSTTERVVRQAPCPVLAVRGIAGNPTAKLPKIRHVLLATDFSENSAKAFPWALALADAFGARLTLMHVVERLTRDTVKQLMAEAHTQLNVLARSLVTGSERAPHLAVRFGRPFDEITRGARELDASLVVIATHGHTGLKRVYLGSVAERVVRHAHCPVLVVQSKKT